MMLRRSVSVRCCKSEGPSKPSATVQGIQALRKRLEDSRATSVRENWSKVVAIATADVKFADDVLKELDAFHKSILDKSFNKVSPVKADEAENIFKDEP